MILSLAGFGGMTGFPHSSAKAKLSQSKIYPSMMLECILGNWAMGNNYLLGQFLIFLFICLYRTHIKYKFESLNIH